MELRKAIVTVTHHDDEAESNDDAERNYEVRVYVEWKIVIKHERETLKTKKARLWNCLCHFTQRDSSPFKYM